MPSRLEMPINGHVLGATTIDRRVGERGLGRSRVRIARQNLVGRNCIQRSTAAQVDRLIEIFRRIKRDSTVDDVLADRKVFFQKGNRLPYIANNSLRHTACRASHRATKDAGVKKTVGDAVIFLEDGIGRMKSGRVSTNFGVKGHERLVAQGRPDLSPRPRGRSRNSEALRYRRSGRRRRCRSCTSADITRRTESKPCG